MTQRMFTVFLSGGAALFGLLAIIFMTAPERVVIETVTETVIETQLVEGSGEVTVGVGMEMVQCGTTGSDLIQLCDMKTNIRYTLKITGTACNRSTDVLSTTADREKLGWEPDTSRCK